MLLIITYIESPERKMFKVPNNSEQLPKFRKVLYMTLSNKTIVLDAMKILRSKPDDDNNLSAVMEPPEEDLYQLPSTFDSPEQPNRTRSCT